MSQSLAARGSEWCGLARSFFVYWRPGRQPGLRRLYGRFVSEGDIVFDIGAHLGDRSVAFASLGATVIALEPQPQVARWLKRLVGRNARILLRTEAVGASTGTARLAISRKAPTVSSLSGPWRDAMKESHPGFSGVRWEDSVDVPVVTLDDLIETYGLPSFCKIDVEGFEAEVLTGLSLALPALSVEFVAGQLPVAAACVRRVCELGRYRFNVILGEGRHFSFARWEDEETIIAWLRDGAGGASSGDLYAQLQLDQRETLDD